MLFCLPQMNFAQTKASKAFYKKYKKQENTVNFSIPGWVIDLGAGIAKMTLESKEEKATVKLLKKIQKVKFLVMEDENRVSKNDLKLLVNKLKKEQHEPLITIRDGQTSIHIMLREKEDKLENLTILIAEPDEFVYIGMKTKIKMKDINQLIDLLDAKFDVFPEDETEEKPIPEEEDKPLIRA